MVCRSAAVSRWIPNAEFIFQDLRRGESAANELIVGPLLRVTEMMQALIDARNRVTELMAGIHRVEVSLIPSVTDGRHLRTPSCTVTTRPLARRGCRLTTWLDVGHDSYVRVLGTSAPKEATNVPRVMVHLTS